MVTKGRGTRGETHTPSLILCLQVKCRHVHALGSKTRNVNANLALTAKEIPLSCAGRAAVGETWQPGGPQKLRRTTTETLRPCPRSSLCLWGLLSLQWHLFGYPHVLTLPSAVSPAHTSSARFPPGRMSFLFAQ